MTSPHENIPDTEIEAGWGAGSPAVLAAGDHTVDFSPLSAPVHWKDIAEEREAAHILPKTISALLFTAIPVAICVLVATILHSLFALIVGAVFLVNGVRWVAKLNREVPGMIRARRFTDANGLTWTPVSRSDFDGAIFDHDGFPRLTQAVVGNGFWFGNFQYVDRRHDDNDGTVWGVTAMNAGRELPHIILVAKHAKHRIPILLDHRQILHLEGDFDRYFTVYCPSGHEQEALYLLTPDVMAALIDNAAGTHVELIGNRIRRYSPTPIRPGDETGYREQFRFVGAIASRVSRTANNYVGDITAGSGTRNTLRGAKWPIVLTVVFFVAMWLWSVLPVPHTFYIAPPW